MALELWNWSTGPFTDLFEHFFGNGAVFYLVPLIVLTIGLYIKTNNVTVPSMFMIGAGSILAVSTFTLGLPDMALIFTIFTAIGIGSLFINLIYGG
jgi:hypothetical protein